MSLSSDFNMDGFVSSKDELTGADIKVFLFIFRLCAQKLVCWP